MTHCCPTCGSELRGQFAWSPEERTFTAESGRVQFPPVQADIFNAIWRAGKPGIPDREQFMQEVYGNRADGGPDFNTISQFLARMRERLEPLGYTITRNMGKPRQGWRLVKIPDARRAEIIAHLIGEGACG